MSDVQEPKTPNVPVDIRSIFPSSLLLIPLRQRPLFPGIMAPVQIENDQLVQEISQRINESDFLGFVLTKTSDVEHIDANHIHRIGVVAKVIRQLNMPDGHVNVLINSLERFTIKEILRDKDGLIEASVQYVPHDDVDTSDPEIKAMMREIFSFLRNLTDENPMLNEQIKVTLANTDDPSRLTDFVASILNLGRDDSQDLLQEFDVRKRIMKLLNHLGKEQQVMDFRRQISQQINERLETQQREFFLREQLKLIREELGMDSDPRAKATEEFAERLKALTLPAEVLAQIEKELERFQATDPQSSEGTVLRNYLDAVLSLPWGITSKDNKDIRRAERLLNRDHYGLEDVKSRILEFLAVRQLKSDAQASIVALVGPPGVGKTSLGRSIAEALNREFYRFSVGGMRDEAEIKGHRRTYVGAMPGKIIQALRYKGKANLVLMIDEIDKMGVSYQGDPASALLEVLDPEQNSTFVDHYIDLPFDLSQILFIVTANTLDTIPGPLLDRMEVIRLAGYIEEEKVAIGKKYLVPRQLERHGLDKEAVKIDKRALTYIVRHYAREAGVRTFERMIGKIMRKVATKIARGETPDEAIHKEQIRELLGPEVFEDDDLPAIKQPGVVYGLAWTSMGGTVMTIEANAIPGGSNFRQTGQLGDVMVESASIALTLVRTEAQRLNLDPEWFNRNSIHLHVPAGATPKDGPSAGITMATCLLSLVSGTKAPNDVGMTGELTLKGNVLPIGGLKEKIISAKRSGLKRIILPKSNERDLSEIPEAVKSGLTFIPVRHVDEVFKVMGLR